jgi:hypothetical protein
MSEQKTTFTALEHGYKFANRFDYSMRFELPLLPPIDLGELVLGLCGGMCFAALDYYSAGREIPGGSRRPAAGTERRRFLERRQFESLVPPDGILKVIHWMVRSDRDVARMTAGREFRKLRTRIGRGEPAVLALIRMDEHGDPTKNHQVIATGYQLGEQSRSLRVDLYDPNHPRKTPKLTFDLRNPARGIAPRQSTGEVLRGFFVIDYRKRPPP